MSSLPDANESVRPAAADRRTARLLVGGQFALLALILLLPERRDWQLPSWLSRSTQVAVIFALLLMAAAATSLGRGLTAIPLPNAKAQLRTGGLYRFVRHPIYSGLLLFAGSEAIASGSYYRAAACFVLVLLIVAKARWEERWLVARFDEYAGYARRTPRFLPSLKSLLKKAP